MSPFLRPESPHLQVAPTVILPGRGRARLPQRSTGTTRMALARAMEHTLRELVAMGYADLLERYITDPTLTPAELHGAKLNGTLEAIRQRAADPLLSTIVERARRGVKDSRTLTGFSTLLRLAGRDARMSRVMEPARARALLLDREAEGVSRNGVRRSLYRAIALTIREHAGRARQLAVLQEAGFTKADDERKLPIKKRDVQRLLQEIVDPLFLELVRVALGTGMDRTPILRFRPKHLEDGVLTVIDGKTATRFRSFETPRAVQVALQRAAMLSRASADDLAFPYTPAQVRHHWEAAVRRAGIQYDDFGWLRFKDCRAIFATGYLSSGGNLKNMMHIMGLSSKETAVRYANMVPDDHLEEMEATAEWLGINGYLQIKETA